MSNTVLPSVVQGDDAAYRRDAALYDVIAKHGFRPVVFNISEAEAAELAERFAKVFRFPALDAPADARNSARKQSDAALLTAIRKRKSKAAELSRSIKSCATLRLPFVLSLTSASGTRSTCG
jgi:hypothetical protein